MPVTLADLAASKGYIVADGSMGTQLFALGLCAGDPPEAWNLSKAEQVQAVHRAYVRAGAELLLTNSFGANRLRLALHNQQDQVDELNRAAVRNARIAVETRANGKGRPADRRTAQAANTGNTSGIQSAALAGMADIAASPAGTTVLVAGAMGPSGELLQPMGNMSTAACESAFAEQAAALTAGGADLLWIETMSHLDEVEAAVRGARAACDLPVAVTMSFDTAGRTMMGVTGTELAERLSTLGLAAVGANCGSEIADTEAAVKTIAAAATNTLVITKPNAGIPEWRGDSLVYSGTPEVLAAHAYRAREAGATIIGSCCGSTPAHTAKIVAVLRGDDPPPDIKPTPPTTSGTAPRKTRRRTGRR